MAPSDDTDDELDPAVERIRRRLVRLLAVSSGIMVLGFASVVIAVLYRISERDAEPAQRSVPLPIATEALADATLAGDRLLLRVGGERPRLEVRRLEDGALIREFTLDDQER